jgi:hypothetical protein
MPALAPNSLIAVTRITGYIASHVGLAALQADYRVRGTIRSHKGAESLKAGYAEQGIPVFDLDDRLEFVVIDDLLFSDQWLNAIEESTASFMLRSPWTIKEIAPLSGSQSKAHPPCSESLNEYHPSTGSS